MDYQLLVGYKKEGGIVMRAYLMDIGILLEKKDAEFESYSVVYDKKYRYFDEDQCYVRTKKNCNKGCQRICEKRC